MPSPTKFTLANGVRVLVEPVSHVQSAAIGLWCKTGSRHEFDHEAGITHLIEHMLFKGTEHRTAKEIAEAIEGRGGMLNAFTDKEATCYYCRVLAADVPNGIDVLTDMMLHSLIDPEELEREEGVVIEEISRSEDEPESHVHEIFLERRWEGHPLGKPIIGTRESVRGFKQPDLRSYMERRYRGGNVLLSAAGNVDPDTVRGLAEQALAKIPAGSGDEPLPKPIGKTSRDEITKDVEQVHFCIGGDACAVQDDETYVLRVVDALLGGGMSSRLFQEIREKRGLAYSVGSYSLNYEPGGAFVVYGGTSPKTWRQVEELVHSETKRLVANGLEDGELERTKRNLSGHLVLALEGMNARMTRMARNELIFGREVPVEEALAKLEAVTEAQVIELVERTFGGPVSTAAIGPF